MIILKLTEFENLNIIILVIIQWYMIYGIW